MTYKEISRLFIAYSKENLKINTRVPFTPLPFSPLFYLSLPFLPLFPILFLILRSPPSPFPLFPTHLPFS